ncbi:penicillin-binding protein [Nocardioides jiangxiensis]|uniref:Transglycosylase domain-containing protein n=1 Tax=Nocardioides jiangxiensis TaxID=3064524 RepID=A0ABT9B0P6_9ACTN|nr:transglycosylase domain-containing protein [Nocardioides sp. WY-20]MDO7868437.1 transglycosylase domain-containing protein [Nocardioides sp. WY-20]
MSDPLDDDRIPPNQVLGHLWVMALVSVALGIVVAGLAIPFAGVLGFAARDVSDSMSNLPQGLETKPLAQASRIVAKDGTPIATLYDENRVNVPLTQVAPVMREAIISIEDYRFYQHGAIDLKGTLRALVTNQAAGETVQGGSSITQQMVKLTLLSQAKTKAEQRAAVEESVARKIKELRYAIAFEQEHSKDWILERYLNLAYFGDGVYGIQAAARHYFSTDAKRLTLGQAALLAGLVKNPVGYDPTRNPNKAFDRRNIVLERMAQLRAIPLDKAKAEAKKPLGLDITANRNGCMFSRAPFFCDYVVNYLLKDPSLGTSVEERKALLQSGGLTIKTTLDPRFQDAADAAVERYVYPTDNAIGGMAMVEPGTGAVRAIAQSRPMGLNTKRGESMINYVVPKEYGGSGGFLPGSTFKPFVLAAAIRQGIPLTTTFNAPPFLDLPQADFANCPGAGNFVGTWPVHNAGGQNAGARNLYTGTAGSINTFYAQLERKTGVCEPWQIANKLGVHVPVHERQPAMVLGTSVTSPLEVAEAYATFAARGVHCDARPVTALLDANKNVVKTYAKDCTQVLPSPVADAVDDVLQGAFKPGGTAYGIPISQPTAGKTGTETKSWATWLTGFTPNLAMSAFIGGVNSAGHPISLNGQSVGGRYISNGSGAGTTGPMWSAAMSAIAQWLPDLDFHKPDSADIKGVLVQVPSVGGMNPDDAQKVLEKAGFNVTISGGQVDSSYPQGTVAYTSPGGGATTGSGDLITIYISDGTPYVKPKPKKTKGGDKPSPTNGGGKPKPGH